MPSKDNFPDRIIATASVRSTDGKSIFDEEQLGIENVENFYSDSETRKEARNELLSLGFEILESCDFSISIAGSRELYESVFGIKLTARRRAATKLLDERNFVTHIEVEGPVRSGYIATKNTTLENTVEGIAINIPMYFFADAVVPEGLDYWYLDPPKEISNRLNASSLHEESINGAGVKVVIIDSGFYHHPYFEANHFDRPEVHQLNGDTTDPQADELGHGTAMVANFLAIAAKAELHVIKTNKVRLNEGFQKAIELNPDIISCSWGAHLGDNLYDSLIALQTSIVLARKKGITVLAASGNGKRMFPGQHPLVISVGGVYQDQDGNNEASDLVSGYRSNVYQGRRCPDICGLAGKSENQNYLVLPTYPGSELDVKRNKGYDGTTADDGWAGFSGSSNATAQIAGVCALLKQKFPRLSPDMINEILRASATDVVHGMAAINVDVAVAGAGEDLATGKGLVDAQAAYEYALQYYAEQ